MFIKESGYTLVLAGKWNLSILTPAWIVSNLFDPTPEVQIEFSLNFDMPARYRIKNIIIAPSIDRIIFISSDNSDDSLSLMERVAIRLCSILRHTPVNAVGINFGYIEKDDKDNLLKLMEFENINRIVEEGWELSEQAIKINLKKDIYFINLTISINPSSDFVLDFNFHYPTLNSQNVSEKLENKVLDYKNQSLSLLNSLFTLKIEQNV